MECLAGETCFCHCSTAGHQKCELWPLAVYGVPQLWLPVLVHLLPSLLPRQMSTATRQK